MTKIKKNVCKRNKKRYLFLVSFSSTPDAQEMAFEATRNMPFCSVLQKVQVIRHATEKSSVCFVAVILKVLLINLLAALNFANVF